MKTVSVVPYDDRWPETFAGECARLSEAMGPAALAVHHIGSTSVPGLSAKPVIDVLVEAASVDQVDLIAPNLAQRGYEAKGEYGISGRRYFVGRPEGLPLFHVHVFARGDEHIARHLRLRDYLREHDGDARRYGRLKTELAGRFALDRPAYQDAKAPFVEELHGRALEWRPQFRSMSPVDTVTRMMEMEAWRDELVSAERNEVQRLTAVMLGQFPLMGLFMSAAAAGGGAAIAALVLIGALDVFLFGLLDKSGKEVARVSSLLEEAESEWEGRLETRS